MFLYVCVKIKKIIVIVCMYVLNHSLFNQLENRDNIMWFMYFSFNFILRWDYIAMHTHISHMLSTRGFHVIYPYHVGSFSWTFIIPIWITWLWFRRNKLRLFFHQSIYNILQIYMYHVISKNVACTIACAFRVSIQTMKR